MPGQRQGATVGSERQGLTVVLYSATLLFMIFAIGIALLIAYRDEQARAESPVHQLPDEMPQMTASSASARQRFWAGVSRLATASSNAEAALRLLIKNPSLPQSSAAELLPTETGHGGFHGEISTASFVQAA